jgi:hypothetical protein
MRLMQQCLQAVAWEDIHNGHVALYLGHVVLLRSLAWRDWLKSVSGD